MEELRMPLVRNCGALQKETGRLILDWKTMVR